MTREAELERIKRLIADLEGAGVTLYKLALLCDVKYEVAKRWRDTGKVWSWYARRIEELHRQCNPPPLLIGSTSRFVTTSILSTDS